MADYIDDSYWRLLAEADPAVICRQKRCRFFPETGDYQLRLWGLDYRIDRQRREIVTVGNAPAPHPYFNVFIVSYLLLDREIAPVGEWVSEKDFPGGATFFRGPHLLPTALVAERYQDDLAAFSSRCRELGGLELAMADRAFSFTITPDIPVAALYWSGDLDFPAEAKILYDRSLIGVLALDVMYSLAVTICYRLAGRTHRSIPK